MNTPCYNIMAIVLTSIKCESKLYIVISYRYNSESNTRSTVNNHANSYDFQL